MNKQLEALRMPERIRRDWNGAVMRTCEHCDSWHMTVIHTDGSAMCAGCCDAYYTDQLKEALTTALGRIAELEASPLTVKLPPRKTAADYVDDVFTNEDLAAIYNVTRLECSVRIKNAGGTVSEGE